ncbi:MAG: hypothetical protein M3Q71_15130 [Chloroflexota bacterium]|nr:hypothetical protein [Chloroflexota bacterium]
MNHERRLRDLETIYQRPAAPMTRQFDPTRLTAEERADLERLREALEVVDVGPVRLDPRSDRRARLGALTDEQFERLRRLLRKGWGQETSVRVGA